jgi:3-hydroxyacyl-CoA dehydrogenase / enoyl-CoA hydratase / 3-hydroxybutyryl-CoA epimerase
MNLTNFRFETDADGIALVTWDMPGRSMNVINAEVVGELGQIVDKIATDEAIKGAVFTSGKDGFAAGADLTMLETAGKEYARRAKAEGKDAAMRALVDGTKQLSLVYRRLETCGKPIAAAINGVCMGGGFEMALACHYRIVADTDKARVGLPEIKVGLFPGAGGTQRVARLMPTPDALQMLLKGDQIRPAAAKKMGLVHDVAPADQIVTLAKAWVKANPNAKAPWDDPKFKLPSGKVFSPAGMMIWPPANAIYRRETYDNYPAAKAVLTCVFEGLQLPMDLALAVEAKHFVKTLLSKEAAAMIRSLFLSMGELNKGVRRPADVPPTKLRKVGVLGAGLMGAGIAYVSANAGLDVVLIDRDQASADKGKAYSDKLVSSQIAKGRAKTADKEALLTRITPTGDYAALKGCDLIIEAVFEDRAVKEEATKKAQAIVGPDVVFASNTSTLPIGSLAGTSLKPEHFIGVHFFSPVEKMMLTEIIMGKKTGAKALATAMDFVRAIKKTPIVVNDCRGFYVNRCVGNYMVEAHAMVMEGVPPAMIENAAKMAGMPVGPLALNDEVGIDLSLRILQATKKDLGANAINPAQEELIEGMAAKEGRLGRKNGKGFYDYPANGPKSLWPGLGKIVGKRLDPDAVSVKDLKDRFLFTVALEAARCVDEGIVTDPREADVGSILGFGFAPYSGGALSFIDSMGLKTFVARAKALAGKYGSQFEPGAKLVEMAERGETFYGTYGEKLKAA